MMNSNYQIDNILYQLFKIIFSISYKNMGIRIDNPLIRTYVKKIEKRIIFKIKTTYYLDLLTPETMKLLGSTGNNIKKD